MASTNEFCTPMGTIVCRKSDSPSYPGFSVLLVAFDGTEHLLTEAEYDVDNGEIACRLYGDVHGDEPTDVMRITHEDLCHYDVVHSEFDENGNRTFSDPVICGITTYEDAMAYFKIECGDGEHTWTVELEKRGVDGALLEIVETEKKKAPAPKKYRTCMFDSQADALNMLNNMPFELAMAQPTNHRLCYFRYDDDDNPSLFAVVLIPKTTAEQTEVRLYQH